MNVAILNLRSITKKVVEFMIRLILFISLTLFLLSNINKIHIDNIEAYSSIHSELTLLNKPEEFLKITPESFLSSEIRIMAYTQETTKETINIDKEIKEENNIIVEEVENNTEDIPKEAITEEVTDRNISETYTNIYNSVKIKNQSIYEITDDMLVPDVEINNIKDILIYHTHTCESYTPSEKYPYEMTGNYRTTDLNYSVVRVGRELERVLKDKGFNVIHSETLHDYPSYNGSYERSLETVMALLESRDNDIELVFDIHRDAVGDGDSYGPTVKINGESVAQLMFVIGTNGSGLEHPNWIQNLKVAIKIQEKANELYPGLFRPIVIRNSRYNQHISKGASIIEVGATANTLDEAILSMQCLANVLEELKEKI